MAIIDVVTGDGSRASRYLSVRFGWLMAIWLASTVAFLSAAALLRLLVPK